MTPPQHDCDGWDIHGGLRIYPDGNYSAERGINPVADVERCLARMEIKSAALRAFLSAYAVQTRAEEELA